MPYRLGYIPKIKMGWMMGFEPTHAGATILCLNRLTTPTIFCWSGRRDSNPRPSPWQGDALPLSHFRIWCGWRDLNPHGRPLDPKSSASANSATPAYIFINGGGRRIRTFEVVDNRFTVCPLWPLGNPSVLEIEYRFTSEPDLQNLIF